MNLFPAFFLEYRRQILVAERKEDKIELISSENNMPAQKPYWRGAKHVSYL